MRAFALFAIAMLAVVAAADEAVVTLNKDSFDAHLASKDHVLVEFYAPWCGHCKALAPEYEAAANKLAKANLPGVLAKVDCTEEKDLCAEYDVQGFPTLKLFTKGSEKPSDYEDARKEDALVKFMLKQSQPAYKVYNNAAEVVDFSDASADDKEKDDTIEVVGYFADENSAEAQEFKATAQALRNDFDFAISTVAANGAQLGSVVLYKSFDEKVVTFKGDIKKDALVSFIEGESLPVFGEIGPENFQLYVDRKLPLLWVFADYAQNADSLSAAGAAADDFKNKVIFCKLDGVKWGEHGKSFGLKSTTPGLVIEDRSTRKNYLFSQAVTEANIVAWVNDFLAGKLTANVKTQPEPETNEDPVKVIVGSTFEKIVMDPTKDVFVEFYAPWCGHCKSLAPKYEEVAIAFQKNPSVVIAKIDATENDTPVDIEGFPTLFFYPSTAKNSPIKYEGDRSPEAMEAFVRLHAVTLGGSGVADAEAEADDDNKDEL